MKKTIAAAFIAVLILAGIAACSTYGPASAVTGECTIQPDLSKDTVQFKTRDTGVQVARTVVPIFWLDENMEQCGPLVGTHNSDWVRVPAASTTRLIKR